MKLAYQYVLDTANITQYQLSPGISVMPSGTGYTISSELDDGAAVVSSATMCFSTLETFAATTTAVASGTSTFVETTSACNVYFQISNDSMNWYFYNETTAVWETADMYNPSIDVRTQSNLANVTNDHVAQFTSDLDGGRIMWRAIFVTDGTAMPVLYETRLTGQQYYTTIKKARDMLKQIGIRDYNPMTGEVIKNTPKDFLSDENIEIWMEMADKFINEMTFRDFHYHSNVDERHDGNDQDCLVARYFPILKIHRIVMYNQLLQHMRTYVEDELIVHPEWGEIFLPPITPTFLGDQPTRAIFGNIFIRGRRNIQIVYDYGYECTPDGIELAARRWVGIQVLNSYWLFLNKGVQSRSVAGYSESYFGRPWGDLMEAWGREIDFILGKHKRYSGGLRGI